MNITELREFVGMVLEEDKRAKKKDKPKARACDALPHGYAYSEANDFMRPLGEDNRLHLQGEAPWGPSTGVGLSMNIDDNIVLNKNIFRFEEGKDRSAWDTLKEATEPAAIPGAWERALREGPEVLDEYVSPYYKYGPSGKVPPPKLPSKPGQPQPGPDDKKDEAAPVTTSGEQDLVKHPMGPLAGEGAEMDEKHVGFKKLKGQLAHKKGVHDPGALAAYIGREKYGAKGMAKKAAAGRK